MNATLKKQTIDPLEHLSEIMKGVKKASLITTKAKGIVNTMTISWGQIGIEWNKLIFTVYVRTGRHTHQMLVDSNEFTINIGFGEDVDKITAFCGTKSGANVDKIAAMGLTLVPGTNIETPGIKELPLTLECKIIYKQLQDKVAIPASIKERFYPENIPSHHPRSNNDYHTMFYGEIVGAYKVK
jgi:flavin reductase (DIM6/NTAB) family NADH-FMN oxidoreductase RutF